MQKIKQDLSIGKNMKELREKAGLTQEQAVAKLQLEGLAVSREMLSQMERGGYNVAVSILIALKRIYKVSTFDLFFKDLS